jgi:hypothetical protein
LSSERKSPLLSFNYETRKPAAKPIPSHTDTGKVIGSFKGN